MLFLSLYGLEGAVGLRLLFQKVSLRDVIVGEEG